MCLTAVMGLVHEQMGQHMSCEIALDATFAAVHFDDRIAAGRVEPVAKRDQSLVAAALALGKRRDVVGPHEQAVVGRQIRLAVQRADVVEIDGQIVSERCSKTRGEADAGRVKIGTRQICERRMQAPVASRLACAWKRSDWDRSMPPSIASLSSPLYVHGGRSRKAAVQAAVTWLLAQAKTC